MNPYNYEAHLQRIETLSGQEHVIERLKARQETAQVFAISPQQALDWIADIRFLSGDEAEKLHHVRNVYSWACNDYHYVDLWIQYSDFLCEIGVFTDDKVLRKDTFKYDITACHRWYRYQYPTTEDKSRFFMELLNLPHLNHAESFQLYQEWKRSQTSDPAEYDKAVWWMKKEGGYDKAVVQLERLQKFENSLVQNQHSWETYQAYISQIPKLVFDKSRHNDYIIALYERAILNGNMLNEELWKLYIEFCRPLYSDSEMFALTSRAVRNVTWSLDLWLMNLRLQQIKHGDDLSKINVDLPLLAMDAYMRANIDTTVVLLMEVTSIHIRQQFQQLGTKAPLKKKTEAFQETFRTYAFEKFSEYHPNISDPYARLERRYAKMLYHINPKESAEAIGTFEDIFQQNVRKKYSELWLDYINFLQRVGNDIDVIRNVFKQALDVKNIYSLDWPEILIEKWKEFEDIFGDLESLKECWKTVDSLLPKIVKRRQKEAEKGTTHPVADLSSHKVTYEPQKHKSEKKRQADSDQDGESVAEEEEKKTRTIGPSRLKDSDPEKASLTVFVSNLPKDITEGKLQYMFRSCGPTADIRIVCDDKNARTFAYVEFPTVEATALALKLDKTPIDGTKRELFVSEFKPKVKPEADAKSLFVSNLPNDSDEKLLRTIFEPCGTVSSVRMSGKKFQNRPCAFVQFESDESAKLALSLNDLDLGNDIKIRVERSRKPKPPVKENRPAVPANLVPTHALGAKRGPSTARIGTSLSFQQPDDMEVDAKPKSNQDFRSLLRN